MAGFKFTPPAGPVPSIARELLARWAQAGFRPPPAMQVPSAPGMQPMMPPSPGFNVGDGGRLSDGLAGWKPRRSDPRTAGDADLAGYNRVGPTGMVDVGNGVMLPNPNGNQYGAGGSLIGALDLPDFWSGARLQGGFNAYYP